MSSMSWGVKKCRNNSVGTALSWNVGPTSIVNGCTTTLDGSLDHSILRLSSPAGRVTWPLPWRDRVSDGGGRGSDAGVSRGGDAGVSRGGDAGVVWRDRSLVA